MEPPGRAGTPIVITLRNRSTASAVPLVEGLTLDEAHSLLEKDRLRTSASCPEGGQCKVLDQSPDPGASISEDRRVQLEVVLVKALVPNVEGRVETVAETKIEARRLVFDPQEPCPAVRCAVRVGSQSPKSGYTKLESHISVELVAVMPDLEGEPGEEAAEALNTLGVKPEFEGQGDLVERTDPPPDEPLDPGQVVIVYLTEKSE